MKAIGMPKDIGQKKKEIQEIIDRNGFIDVFEGKISNNGSVYVSVSKKKDICGYPVLVIVMNKDNGGKAPVEKKGRV
jgi:hypothetical protein